MLEFLKYMLSENRMTIEQLAILVAKGTITQEQNNHIIETCK